MGVGGKEAEKKTILAKFPGQPIHKSFMFSKILMWVGNLLSNFEFMSTFVLDRKNLLRRQMETQV